VESVKMDMGNVIFSLVLFGGGKKNSLVVIVVG
jgi:hypothetical protein